jgi:hypothetical protein
MVPSQIVGRLLTIAVLAGATACGSANESVPAAASATSTATASPPQVSVLLQQALPNAEGKTFTSQIVDFPPGAAAPPHRHGQAFANPSTTERAKLLVVSVSNTGDPLQANDPHA